MTRNWATWQQTGLHPPRGAIPWRGPFFSVLFLYVALLSGRRGVNGDQLWGGVDIFS